MSYKINENGANRDTTPEETANLDQLNDEANKAATAATAQAAAKKSAYKKLAALGLTADEIAAL